jgi:hypothetical protein
MRIARSDGGTRPSSRFPNSSLQPNDSCGSLLQHSSKPRWRAAVGGAQVHERGQRGDRRRHAAGEAVLVEAPAPQRARSHLQVGHKPPRRRRGAQDDQLGERHDARQDRAGEAVLGQVPNQAQCSMRRMGHKAEGVSGGRAARHAPHRREPGRCIEAYSPVSAVSAEIVGGALPEKRLPRRRLRQRAHPQARVGRKTARRRRRVQGDQPGERRDARQDRAGEAVHGQVPDHAQ